MIEELPPDVPVVPSPPNNWRHRWSAEDERSYREKIGTIYHATNPIFDSPPPPEALTRTPSPPPPPACNAVFDQIDIAHLHRCLDEVGHWQPGHICADCNQVWYE